MSCLFRDHKKLSMISLCVIFLTVLVVTISSAYSVPASDDYWHTIAIGSGRTTSFVAIIEQAIKFAIFKYNTASGSFFTYFLQAVLSPLNHFGMTQQRIVMVLNALFFSFSLCYFVYYSFPKTNRKYALFYVAIVLFMILGLESYPEVFFWLSGAVGYSIPLSFSLLSLGLLFKHGLTFKTFDFTYFLILLFGIFAVTGLLAITFIHMYVILGINVYCYIKNKKINKHMIFMMVILVVFSIITIIAPGNFVRYVYETGNSSTDLKLFNSIVNSCITVGYAMFISLFTKPMYILLLVGTYLFTVFHEDMQSLFMKEEKKYFIVFVLLSPFVMIYPVVLGYNHYTNLNRQTFLLNVTIALAFVYVIYELAIMTRGLFLKRRSSYDSNKTSVARYVFCFLLLFSFFITTGFQMSIQLIRGQYKESYNSYIELFEYIAENENKNLVITEKEMPLQIPNYLNFQLSSDPNVAVNRAIAQIYHLESIRYEE